MDAAAGPNSLPALHRHPPHHPFLLMGRQCRMGTGDGYHTRLLAYKFIMSDVLSDFENAVQFSGSACSAGEGPKIGIRRATGPINGTHLGVGSPGPEDARGAIGPGRCTHFAGCAGADEEYSGGPGTVVADILFALCEKLPRGVGGKCERRLDGSMSETADRTDVQR